VGLSRQEGRGIALINKLKAYSLQERRLDTVGANERLRLCGRNLRNYVRRAQSSAIWGRRLCG